MENKNNIEKIKQFLSIKKNDTILINQVDEEIGRFYELVIKEISKEIDIKISINTDKIDPGETSDLFQEEKIYLYHYLILIPKLDIYMDDFYLNLEQIL